MRELLFVFRLLLLVVVLLPNAGVAPVVAPPTAPKEGKDSAAGAGVEPNKFVVAAAGAAAGVAAVLPNALFVVEVLLLLCWLNENDVGAVVDDGAAGAPLPNRPPVADVNAGLIAVVDAPPNNGAGVVVALVENNEVLGIALLMLLLLPVLALEFVVLVFAVAACK